MKIPAPLILFILILKTAFSQEAPWNAKLMLHSVNGYIDTLKIGCDINGDWGYQMGLDIIDTSLTPQGSIWGYDSLVNAGSCFNLKKDIKNFVTGTQWFDLDVIDTDFNQGFQYDSILIDTNDFKFDNGDHKITSVHLESLSGYIFFIDSYEAYLYNGLDSLVTPKFHFNSVPLIFESDLTDCLPVNDYYQMELRLVVTFNYYLNTAVEEVENMKTVIYPNPASSTIQVQCSIQSNIISLFNLFGEKVKEEKVTGKQVTLNVSSLPQGVYLVRTENRVVGKFVKE